MTGKRTLSPDELQILLQHEPEWALADGMLVREWSFPGFTEAMAFVDRVAALAEQANHHPDIDIRYNRVRLALASHDAGGITARDTKMVGELNRISIASTNS